MPKSNEAKMEAETIIHWDELTDEATLWTASSPVRQEWESYGFKVVKSGRGWYAQVPVSRISYKLLKKA